MLIASIELSGYLKKLNSAQADQEKFYVNDLGGYLPIDFRRYVDIARSNSKIVLEEYWGIFSAINKKPPIWPVDSVIHALGSKRSISENSIKNADLVITTRHILSMEWQPWSLSQNFWLYDDLLKNWEIIETSPTTIVWARGKASNTTQSVFCEIYANKQQIKFEAPNPGFYRVEIDYEVHNPRRRLLMLQNNISYAVDANGFISIDPYGSTAIYPVYTDKRGEIELKTNVVNGVAEDFRLNRCTVSKIIVSSPDILFDKNQTLDKLYFYYNGDALKVDSLDVPEEFYLTDANWIGGIARNHSGFFVPNIKMYRDIYLNPVKEMRVLFPNGHYRKVVSVVEAGAYLNVFVDGDILSFENVGYPSSFKLVQ
jgi:hypothetical protein